MVTFGFWCRPKNNMIGILFVALTSVAVASSELAACKDAANNPISVTVANFKEVDGNNKPIKKDPMKVKLVCNADMTKIESCQVPREGNKLLAAMKTGSSVITAVGRLLFGDEDIDKTNGKIYAMICYDTKEPTITVLDYANQICSNLQKKPCHTVKAGQGNSVICYTCKDMQIASCKGGGMTANLKETPAGQTSTVNWSTSGVCKVTCNAWEEPFADCQHM